MRIETVEMSNIRSYDDEKVDFDDGLVLLYGENGAGKSSLLSSVFSGLYMSDVLKYMGDDINLDSLVRRGCDEGQIKLTFGINGDSYTINWVISVRDKNGERQASTKSCTLTGTDIDETVEGVRDVKQSVVDIMGLKPESFVNSVYVQQGDITRMVNASDEKRKEIIDGLLGLSKLDNYRERMDKARLEFGAQRRRISDLLDDKQRQLDGYPEESELRDSISELQSDKKDLQNKRKQANKTINKFQKNIVELKNEIEKYEDVTDRKSKLENSVEEKDEKRKSVADKKEDVQTEIEAIETELDVVNKGISSKREELGRESESLDELESAIDELRDRVSELKGEIREIEDVKIENIEKDISQNNKSIIERKGDIDSNKSEKSRLESDLSDHRSERDELEKDVEQLETEVENVLSDIDSRADNLGIEYENVEDLQDNVIPDERDRQVERTISVCTDVGENRKEKDMYEGIVEDGVCPVCDEEHDEISDHVMDHYRELDETVKADEERVRSIRNQRDELDGLITMASEVQDIRSKIEIKRNNLEQKRKEISRKSEDVERIDEEIEQDQEEIDNLKSDIEDLKEDRSDWEDELEDLKEEKSELEDELEELEGLVEDMEHKVELEGDIDDRRDRLDRYEERRRNAQEQFLEKKRELKQVEDELEDIDVDESKEKKKKYETKLSKLKKKREQFDDEVSDLQEDIASKKQSLKRVEEVKSDINRLQDKMVEASQNETEAETAMQSYNNVKSKLREENIGLLNKYANQIFNSVYDNKVYQQMRISKEYDITLITGDSIEVDPKDLSGGERTIVSLAIRAGVYKLLVERQGSADTLPPFILDEPTTYLDDSHVSNLQSVIETITSWDVPQVLIVSHREDMIQNADSGYEVEKNPVSETSTVTKRY